MTPTAIRMVSQLRQEFYSLFAAMMKVSVNVTSRNVSTCNPSMAFWVDNHQRLNYLYIYACTAPDELSPECPFVLRLAINKNAGTLTAANRGKYGRELNQAWEFELTLLPNELLDFLPWVIDLIKAYNSSSPSLLPEPPHPIQSKVSDVMIFHSAQTCTAGGRLVQHADRQLTLLSAKP
ncbi:hypothetical protein IFO70_25035 [Phormidium tenue FACHB-886]|nr:hypothetical protein [Phormidium tenue FACHB-886]